MNARPHRFLGDESIFKEDAFLAFRDRFVSQSDFETYYAQLMGDDVKDDFLRVAVAYLFFVKNGDWVVDVPCSNPVISYFTNSYKLVATLGVIESLSDERFEDFYEWLRKKQNAFPIENPKQLNPHYSEYKQQFGAIKRCKSFFTSLPADLQEKLLSCITIDGQHLKRIERFVELLYRTRSRFAHDVRNAAELTATMYTTL